MEELKMQTDANNENTEDSNGGVNENVQDPVKEYGQSIVENENINKRIHCLSIIGQVEGHVCLPQQNKTTKYEHILPQLAAIEEDENIQGILILINTVGGDVEAGLAISEMISSLSKPTVSLVLGGGHSIGVPLSVAAKHSFIVPTATMTIHPIRMNGTVIGVSQTFEYLDRMQERIIDFVTTHSKISKERLRELMLNKNQLSKDMGTIIVGKDAVDLGLIDDIGGIKDALAKLYELIEKNKKEQENQEQNNQEQNNQDNSEQNNQENGEQNKESNDNNHCE